MRILIVHNFYQDFGGEDVVFEQEKKALEDTEHYEIDTLTFKNEKGWRGLLQFALSPWNTVAAKQLHRKIDRFQPDLIHIHNTQYAAGPILIRAATKRHIPVVMSLHNFRLLCPSASLFYQNRLYTESLSTRFPWDAIFKGVLDHSRAKTFWTAFSYWLHRKIGTWQMVKRYFVLAPFSKRLISQSTIHLDSAKIVVKPNFFQPQPAQEEVKRGEHYLFIGRISSEKGILELVKTWKNLRYPLRIAGDGPLMEQLRSLSKDAPNIQLLGHLSQQQVRQQLASCKALVVPSICYEGGVPLNIIEAFETRTPVLASELGAIAEIFKSKASGFTFDPHSPESIAARIQEFEGLSVAEIEAMSEKNNAMVRQEFSKRHILDILTREYQNVVSINA